MKAMSVSNTVSMLNNPNIVIGDSGASTHSTQFGRGIINIKRGHTIDSVMVGSGNVMTVYIVGNLPGIKWNRFGERIEQRTPSRSDSLPKYEIQRIQYHEVSTRGMKSR